MLTTIKGQIESNTVTVGDFNTPLSSVDRSSKMKINKETQALNDTLNKIDIIFIYRNSIQKQQNTLSSQLLMEHSQRQTITLGHKTSLNKFKKTEIIQIIFSYHNRRKLEIKSVTGKKLENSQICEN